MTTHKKEICPAGHERTQKNTYVRDTGQIECRLCRAALRRAERAGVKETVRKYQQYERDENGNIILSIEKLRQLRALIPCLVCKQVMDDNAELTHLPSCPHARTKEAPFPTRPRKPWNYTCEWCQAFIPRPDTNRVLRPRRHCTKKCDTAARNEQRRQERLAKNK